MVLAGLFSNSSPSPLTRTLRAFRKLHLTADQQERAAGAPAKRLLRLTPVQIEHLVAGYQAGSTVYELADQFQIHRATVGKYLHEQGIQTRLQPLKPKQVQQGLSLYAQGLSMAKVAERLGCSASLIYLTLKREGVVARDTHGRRRA